MEVFSSSRWRLFLQKGGGFLFKILFVKLWAEKSLQYLKLHCCVALSLSFSFCFSSFSLRFVLRFMRALGNFTMPSTCGRGKNTSLMRVLYPGLGRSINKTCPRPRPLNTHTPHIHTHHRWLGICPFRPLFPALTTPPTWHFNAAKFVNNSFPRFGLHKLLLLAERHNKLYDVSYPKATFLFWPPPPPSGTPPPLLTSSLFFW